MAVTVIKVCLDYFSCISFSETSNSCKVCCRDKNAVCAPYMNHKGNPLYLRKGKPCTVGFCDGAVSANVQLQLCKDTSIKAVFIHRSFAVVLLFFQLTIGSGLRSIIKTFPLIPRANAWNKSRMLLRGCGISLRSWTSILLVSYLWTQWFYLTWNPMEEWDLCLCSQGSFWLITLLAQWWSSHYFSGSLSAFWSIVWWVISTNILQLVVVLRKCRFFCYYNRLTLRCIII